MYSFETRRKESDFFCGRVRTQASQDFQTLGQLVPRETTNRTLKALHGFEDSEKLIETKQNKTNLIEEKKQKTERTWG